MNKKNIITSIAIGLLFSAGVYANEPCKTKEVCLLESIVYLEEESEIDLGFDTADYLPEDFDPYTFYFDLNSVVFLEENETDFISREYLPEDFNPYAIPEDFRHISYIDPEDSLEPVIAPMKILQDHFDAEIGK
ncbi:MAG: hypothetical protein KJN76_00500 [Eudoraea sp.]|nr:hypothetical protein [Eudoraea sp.]